MITMINNAYYYDKVSQQWKKIGSEFIIDSYPVGSFLLWSGTHRYPSGFMECKGQLLNKADYPELFSVIEYTYGGSGNSFNLPKFDDGRFFRSTGGNADTLGRLQGDAIRNITGEFNTSNEDFDYNNAAYYNNGNYTASGVFGKKTVQPAMRPTLNTAGKTQAWTFDASKVVPTANENRPTNSSMIVLIKVKTIVERIPVDNDPYATEIKAGIFKVTNEIKGSRNDVVVTEKAVANNTLSFEPYNKVEVDVFDFLGIGNTVNTKNILGDNSCVSLYTFENDSEGAVLTKAEYSNQAKFGNKSLRFNQVSGETVKLKDSDKIAFKNDFTVTLWFNYDNTANAAVHKDHRIFSIQFFIDLSVSSIVNGIGCGVGNNGRWTVARAEKPFTTFAKYNEGGWNFVVIKRTGAKVEFFMNDEKIDEIDNFTTDGSVATNPIELGYGPQPFKGNIDQVRIFNRALSDREIFNVKNEASSAGSTALALQGTVYLSDKSSVPGRYYNATKAIEAQLPKAQQKANGTFFIKVKQDNSLELVDIRPEFHHKSTTAEYYLDGAWYDKAGNKLPPQTYLPYSVIVTSNNITSVNFENIYPSSKEIGIGQRWVNETKNRQFGVTYTNTAGRPIQISVGYTYTGSNGVIVYINGEPESSVNSSTGSRTLTIPPLATYKFVGVATTVLVSWLELK